MADAFRSQRLVYRAIENNDEDMTFLHSLQLDSEQVAHCDSRLLKPPSKKNSEKYFLSEHETAFLSVIICLPIPSDSEEGKKESSAASKTTLKPVGRIGLWKVLENQRHNRNTNIVIHILAEHQRKGYGSEAIEWVLRWAFQMAGLHRVGIGYASHNKGAGKLYERLGFVNEGRSRESLWYEGGWHDEVSLGMLESEWRARNDQDRGKNGIKRTSTDGWTEVEKT